MMSLTIIPREDRGGSGRISLVVFFVSEDREILALMVEWNTIPAQVEQPRDW